MKILVADDESDVRQALQFLFQKHGHEVILARQGDVALALVFAERPDVVFLDVNMPGKNGLDVCLELPDPPSLSTSSHLYCDGFRSQCVC